MPMYEYRCQRCDEVFELIQRFSDEPLTTHEKCGGVVERLISAPALQFKGTGWYVTDYGKSGSNGLKKDSGDKSKSESKGDSKSSESKSSESKSSDSKTESTKPASSNSSSSSSSSASDK